jgi:hypothetical protein
MKRMICLMTVLAAVAVHAQDSGPYYKAFEFRDTDPFLFCTKGMDIPDPCWVPIPPFTGQSVLTGICDPPTQYGRSWTQSDHDGLTRLEEICPHAQTSGDWDEKGGDPAMTPHKH